MASKSEQIVDAILPDAIGRGWPDRVIWKRVPVAIEIKAGKDELNDEQCMVRELLHSSGWRYLLVRVVGQLRERDTKIIVGIYRGNDTYELLGYPALAQLVGEFHAVGMELVTTDASMVFRCARCGWHEVACHALSTRAPFRCPDCGKELSGKIVVAGACP